MNLKTSDAPVVLPSQGDLVLVDGIPARVEKINDKDVSIMLIDTGVPLTVTRGIIPVLFVSSQPPVLADPAQSIAVRREKLLTNINAIWEQLEALKLPRGADKIRDLFFFIAHGEQPDGKPEIPEWFTRTIAAGEKGISFAERCEDVDNDTKRRDVTIAVFLKYVNTIYEAGFSDVLIQDISFYIGNVFKQTRLLADLGDDAFAPKAKSSETPAAPPSTVSPVPTIIFTGQESPTDLFLILTEWNCPTGFEVAMYGESLRNLGWVQDAFGNFEYVIGDAPRTAFTAHLDTASYDRPKQVIHRWKHANLLGIEPPAWKSGQTTHYGGNQVLGGDDKAGAAIVLYLAHQAKIPGHYFLFLGEERGCIGSSDRAAIEPSGRFDRMISLDRRGYSSIITSQSGRPCCSDAFAEALAAQMNALIVQDGYRWMSQSYMKTVFKPDPTGSFTDSAQFTEIVPECTNLSVGYFSAHSSGEEQDVYFLEDMSRLLTLIAWDELPTRRVIGPIYGSSGHEIIPPYDSLYTKLSEKGILFTELQEWIRMYPISATVLIHELLISNPELIDYAAYAATTPEYAPYFEQVKKEQSSKRKHKGKGHGKGTTANAFDQLDGAF